MSHQFLSDDWFDAVHEIRARYEGQAPPMGHKIKMNQHITDVPFGDGSVKIYMDTSEGEMKMGLGQLDDPDLTVTLDYATAKAILVDGNPQAGMQAFMAGKIKVQGDMTKLMAMQAGPIDPSAQKLAEAISAMTEEIEDA